ncbi:MAG: hypothetical protein O7F71_10015 [Gammaproteobacteria bacterium]|nr:hypothetical protein [Gammaproteobacteria bacterium]
MSIFQALSRLTSTMPGKVLQHPVVRGLATFRATIILALIVLLPVSTVAQEARVYVTDLLRLGLYADELTTGKSFRTLISGERLVVLERALRSVRVRTDDGTEGWVKSAYLVTDVPAILRVTLLEREVAAVNEQLASARAVGETANARVAELETNLTKARNNIRDLPDLKQQIDDLNATLATKNPVVPLYWLLGAAIGALVVGYVAGHLLLARRVRKQFGGLRVY